MENIKLNFAHVCENAFTSSDGKLNIVGIFNQINALKFPAMHPRLMIATNVTGDAKKYSESIEIVSQDGEVIAKANNSIEILKNGDSANFIVDFVGITFTKEGKYKIRVMIDEEEVGSNSIIVKKNE